MKKKETFIVRKMNGKSAVIALPVVGYHLPAIVFEHVEKSAAMEMAAHLNGAMVEVLEYIDNRG